MYLLTLYVQATTLKQCRSMGQEKAVLGNGASTCTMPTASSIRMPRLKGCLMTYASKMNAVLRGVNFSWGVYVSRNDAVSMHKLYSKFQTFFGLHFWVMILVCPCHCMHSLKISTPEV